MTGVATHLVVLVSMLVSMAAAADAPTARLLIPAYFYPSGAGLAAWDKMLTAAYAEATGYIIVNPGSGPGTAVDSLYVGQINRAAERGFRVIGYVATGYGKRSATLIKADIAAYRQMYPNVTGFFLDELADTYVALYEEVAAAVRSVASSNYSVANPGTVPDQRYTALFDTLVVHEDAAAKSSAFAAAPWMVSEKPSKFCWLYHTASNATQARALIAAARSAGIGFIYVTDDVMGNPWDRLPAFYDAMIGQLTRRDSVPAFQQEAMRAVSLLANLPAGRNVYGSGGAFISLTADNTSARTVCATYVTKIIQQTYGTTDAAIRPFLNGSTAFAKNYFAGVVGQTGWVRVMAVEDVRVGDIVVSMYDEALDPSTDTGHVMIVVNATKRSSNTAPLVTETDQWEVWVTDSSASFHGPLDTRAPPSTEGGIGAGVMRLYASTTQNSTTLTSGEIAGWSWSTVSASTYYGQSSTRPVVVGRLIFAANPVVAAAASTSASPGATTAAATAPSSSPGATTTVASGSTTISGGGPTTSATASPSPSGATLRLFSGAPREAAWVALFLSLVAVV